MRIKNHESRIKNNFNFIPTEMDDVKSLRILYKRTKILNPNFEILNNLKILNIKIRNFFGTLYFDNLNLFRIWCLDIRFYGKRSISNSNFPTKMLNKIDPAQHQKGQALITLLFFSIIGVTITTAAVIVIIVNSLSGMKYQQGEQAYNIAVAGTNNALIRLLRTPTTYTGETLTVGEGTATIVVSGAGTSVSPYVIVSTGTDGNFSRKVQLTATYINNQLTPSTPQEIF
jgi:hypothetical protein